MIGRAVGWLAVLLAAVGLGALGVLSPFLAAAVVAGLGLVVLITKPTAAAVLAVVALPFVGVVVPGAPVSVALGDLLTVVALVGWALRHLLQPSPLRPAGASVRAVRVMALGLLAYSGAAVVSMVAHPSGGGLVTAAQRAELVLGPLLLGVGLVRTGQLRPALGGFLLSTSVLALGAVANTGAEGFLGVQKNPGGGFLVAALIVAVVLRPYRWWVFAAPVLAVGALAAQSRGALVGLALAALVTALAVRFGERAKVTAIFAAAGVVLFGGFLTLPAQAQARLTNFSADSDYAVQVRDGFRADALDVFGSSPWWGVGLGNYRGGVRFPGITDPHQVLYLQLAEGGVLLLFGFLALIGWSLWCAARVVRVSAVAAAAIGVQVSTVTHAFVDVYWVRGTPELAFLLLGATLAIVAYRQQGVSLGTPGWTTDRPGRQPGGGLSRGSGLTARSGLRAG